MGELSVIEGGMSRERSVAARLRTKLEALNELVSEANKLGISVRLFEGQREINVSGTLRADLKVKV